MQRELSHINKRRLHTDVHNGTVAYLKILLCPLRRKLDLVAIVRIICEGHVQRLFSLAKHFVRKFWMHFHTVAARPVAALFA